MNNDKQTIPAAIIIAGVLVAVAILMSGSRGNGTVAKNNAPAAQVVDNTDKVNPITENDHVRGSRDAEVIIVEYSDFECPFCQRFHKTMIEVMDKYEDSGKVAWVYRHFPIDSNHPVKARYESLVSECVAEQGGNDAFWGFADRFYELSPSNNRTDTDVLIPQIVGELGLSMEKVTECVESGKYTAVIEAGIKNAAETGGRGTPWSIVIGKNGNTLPLSGAQSFSTIEQIINAVNSTK
ncbi:MAG: protein-disulfide isomerase [Flavobacteriaceae bacterium]|jgi:protein-disulfide isomerase